MIAQGTDRQLAVAKGCITISCENSTIFVQIFSIAGAMIFH